jgi:CubicO group peptidase (beta-lactamase class C family)
VSSTPILFAGGIKSIIAPDLSGPLKNFATEPTGFGRLTPGSPTGYGYQWWVLPHGPTGIHAGAFLAIGAFGQYIYINPAEQVVIAIQSAWRQHNDSDAERETFKLLGAAVRALRLEP